MIPSSRRSAPERDPAMTRLSLRQRVFLFFVALGLGAAAIVAAALWVGEARDGGDGSGYLTAGAISIFGILGLTSLVWLLFDENVARPIQALAAELRARAHGGVEAAIDPTPARYLGDLAPAANAVAAALSTETRDTAARIAAETARLEDERARLTALLTEIPVATLLVTPDDRIALYDGQAAEVLAQSAPPRLGAPVTDYFAPDAWQKARHRVNRTGQRVQTDLPGRDGAQVFSARLSPMADGGVLLIIEDERAVLAPDAARPLVYDFAPRTPRTNGDFADTPLNSLAFAVFDTETTGLLPHKDAVVQIGAVRVFGGRIVPGERLDLLVNPGRPIPPAASAVHGITDVMVRGAPPIAKAGRLLHALASDAVIVAHNAPFDMAFLHRDAEAMGVSWDHPILDTVLLSAVLFGPEQTHTLDALCARLEVSIDPAHRHTALGDALATAEALVRMLPMLEARGMITLGSVIAETRRHSRLLEDLNRAP
jgi:DNA polymerase-3 subunit epsilon